MIKDRNLFSLKNEKTKQEILTPELILERVREIFEGNIMLDPCAPGNNPLRAKKFYTKGDDGLTFKWIDKTFINPPFGDLKKWMQKASEENVEMIFLGPVRTHRKWFYMTKKTHEKVNAFDVFVTLKPLKFQGYDSTFPAPLFLAYKGEKKKEFAEIFKDLATTIIF